MTTKPLIIAHRGASGLVKFENTLASFAKAIELGVSMVEFDVRKTQDNLFVAFHDESIDGIKLSNLTYQQLLDISRQKGFNVPLVEDVLKLCRGKIKLDIELKNVVIDLALVSCVTSSGCNSKKLIHLVSIFASSAHLAHTFTSYFKFAVIYLVFCAASTLLTI